MKKSAISLFLVLAILLSFVGCTTASIDEETTVTSETSIASTTISAEDIDSASNVIVWIDSVFEQKRSDSYGGLRPSIAEQVDLYIQQKIAENPDEGPDFYSIEYLAHPEGTEGFFQVGISFEANNLNKEIMHVAESFDNTNSKLYVKGYSKSQIIGIIDEMNISLLYQVVECDYDYCRLVIYN